MMQKKKENNGMDEDELLNNAKELANKIKDENSKGHSAMQFYIALKMLVHAFEHSEYLNPIAIKKVEAMLEIILETKVVVGK